jgi:hypothetical protein
MKKALLKLMCLVIGLNVFTACYGPAPFPDDEPELPDTEQNDGTKADTEVAPEDGAATQTPENV